MNVKHKFSRGYAFKTKIATCADVTLEDWAFNCVTLRLTSTSTHDGRSITNGNSTTLATSSLAQSIRASGVWLLRLLRFNQKGSVFPVWLKWLRWGWMHSHIDLHVHCNMFDMLNTCGYMFPVTASHNAGSVKVYFLIQTLQYFIRGISLETVLPVNEQFVNWEIKLIHFCLMRWMRRLLSLILIQLYEAWGMTFDKIRLQELLKLSN